jgi:hypothetical protein
LRSVNDVEGKVRLKSSRMSRIGIIIMINDGKLQEYNVVHRNDGEIQATFFDC